MHAFRRVAERLSRERILVRRLPAQFGGGKFYVSPDASLKYLRPAYWRAEPVLFRMVSELVRPGDVVWDIGANVGLFTFAAAARCGRGGRVVAVEPDSWLVSLLLRSASLEVDTRAAVTVIPAGVSDSVGLAKLHIAARGRSANYLDGAGSSQTGGSRASQAVLTVSLDWLLDHVPAPRVLKIDVEGMENRVLQGATRVLSEARPAIWCEVSSHNAEEVTNLLWAAGYGIYDASAVPAARAPLSRAVWDTLAIWSPEIERL